MLIACTFLFKNPINSQNLIQNPSFESYTNPLNCYGGFDNYNATPVYHVVDSWFTLNSSDYFNGTCPNSTFFSPQQNVFGNQNPKIGIAYPGFILFAANYETKEYIYQHLSSPLQAGKTYCLSFYVSRADRITHAIHSIGAYFSNNMQSAASLGYVNAVPQILNQNGFITDTTNWVQIQGCFTANGGEQYITIGNFNSNANTDTLFVDSNDPHPSAYKYAYYYFDDITLIDQTTVGLKDMNYNLGVMNVYPNPAKDVLNIETNFQTKENLTIKITDVIGRENLVSDYNEQLDIFYLEKGIYFVSILHGSKTLGVRKIVKE
ncbi:MAG: T9SS type A sorting domain-containing protein [Bacteroidota bacterium]